MSKSDQRKHVSLKPNRTHKSKKDQKRLGKSPVKVVGEGRFVQRTRKPQSQGKKVKSVLTRIDAGFAAYCRKQAKTEGSITEVTRRIYQEIQEREKTRVNPVTSTEATNNVPSEN